MEGQEQELQRRQMTQSISRQQQQDMEMFLGDKQAIAQYQQNKTRKFQISSKKSMARNYRDYEIYQSLQDTQMDAYGAYQSAVESVVDGDIMFRNEQEDKTQTLKVPGTDLAAKQAVLHLCQSKLLDKDVSTETMKTMVEHLMAGQMWKEGENPNAKIQGQMNTAGAECLKNIYFKHLIALDKKYGEKLISFTPAQYLQAMPQLQQHMSIVEDMRVFFQNYAPKQDEKALFTLMKKKMTFYGDVWNVLQDRARTYIDMDPDKLTERGELNKTTAKDYQKQLRDLRDRAKKDKAFQSWKQPLPSMDDLFSQAKERKSQALYCLSTYGRFAEMVDEKDDLHFLETASDDELLEKFGERLQEITTATDARSDLPKSEKRLSGAGYRGLARRLEEIVRYGCSQGRNLTDEEAAFYTGKLAREALQEDLQKQTDAPMSFQKAVLYGNQKYDENGKDIGIPISSDFTADIPEARMRALTSALEQLRVMKTIRERKERHPELYRFGQSYQDYIHCELMLKRLPVLENLVTLMLRINHLDRYGHTAEDQYDQRELEIQLEQARIECRALYQVTDWKDWKQQLKNDIGRGALLTNEKKEFLTGHPDADMKVFNEEKLKDGIYNCALSFIELPAERQKIFDLDVTERFGSQNAIEDLKKKKAQITGNEQERETIRRDLQRVQCLMDTTKEDELTEEREEAALNLLHRFQAAYDRVIQELTGDGAFTPQSLVEQFAALEQCGLMANFLRANLMANDLSKKLIAALNQPQQEVDRTMLQDFNDRYERLQILYRSARQLMLSQAVRSGVEDIICQNFYGKERHFTSISEISEDVTKNKSGSESELEHKIRIPYLEEKHAKELRDMEMRSRVKNAVGRELIASAKQGEEIGVTGFTAKLGHKMGKALQFLAWYNRGTRVYHGAHNYDKAKDVYEKKLGTLNGSVLAPWQRGDEGLSPQIELGKYYSSPMKQTIHGLVEHAGANNADYEFENEDFARAIEAMQYYSGIEGIVNADTTEMEMAFLDTFFKHADRYMQNNEGVHTPQIDHSKQLLREIKGQLNTNLNGTLASTMSAEEYTLICEQTIAYSEDTTYGANLEESNIKEIPLFTHEPNINDVKQSVIGDCWFVSAISSVVQTNPDFVRSMFQDLGDGNVLVRLYASVDKTGKPLKSIENLNPADVQLRPAYFKLRKDYETGWGNACDCPWVQLLEKAYALGGFSYNHEMEVRGNRLYNVADEMTLGRVDAGIAHLTGHIPELIKHHIRLNKTQMLDQDMIDGLTAGFTDEEIKFMNEILTKFKTIYEALPEDAKDEYTYDVLYVYLNEIASDLGKTWRKRMKIDSQAEVTDQEKEEALTYYENLIKENLTRMKNGERLPFGDHQQALKEEELKKMGEYSTVQRRKIFARYFSRKRNPRYTPEVMRTIMEYSYCIEQGGTVSISIPHFVNIIDVQEYAGKYLFLMREPFNSYNTVYTREKNQVVSKSEGLMEVFTKRNANRHLTDTKEEIVSGGFHGTSWIEAADFYKQIQLACTVTKEMTQIPNYN